MYRPHSKNHPNFVMLEQSTCLKYRIYQGKHNGTVVLTCERHTEQFYREQILHQTITVTLAPEG